MTNRAVISLTTGLGDAEKVTVALLVAVGAAESSGPTLMFLTKEAVRLALDGTACDGCPSIPDLMGRYAAADGRLLVCPICFNTKQCAVCGRCAPRYRVTQRCQGHQQARGTVPGRHPACPGTVFARYRSRRTAAQDFAIWRQVTLVQFSSCHTARHTWAVNLRARQPTGTRR